MLQSICAIIPLGLSIDEDHRWTYVVRIWWMCLMSKDFPTFFFLPEQPKLALEDLSESFNNLLSCYKLYDHLASSLKSSSDFIISVAFVPKQSSHHLNCRPKTTLSEFPSSNKLELSLTNVLEQLHLPAARSGNNKIFKVCVRTLVIATKTCICVCHGGSRTRQPE